MCYKSLVMECLRFSCFVCSRVPDFWLCARSPALLQFFSWDLHVCACLGLFIWLLGLFGGIVLIAVTWFSVFLCILIFLSFHALTVSFGICQHLPSGENSLQVAVCVKN